MIAFLAAPATRGAAPINHLPHHPAPRPPTTAPRGQTTSLLLRLPSRNCVPPNRRIQPTPLRVERDRRFFMCYTCFEGLPDLSSRAADAQTVGWPARFLNGIRILGVGFGAIAFRPRSPRAALPHKPPTPPPPRRARRLPPRAARPPPSCSACHPGIACRPTCASSRRRFASSEIAAFSCAILILRAFPILDRRRG